MPRDGPSGACRRARPIGCGKGRDRPVRHGAGHAEQRVEQEHRLERGGLRHAERGERLGAAGGEGAGGRGERADQAVAGEDGGAPRIGRRLGQHRLLQRHEDADAPGRRIDGAEERQRRDGGEASGGGEAEAGRRHQHGGEQQQAVRIGARACDANPDRHQGGAEQGDRRDRAHLGGAEAERDEVDRQQHRDQAVAEVAQGACPQDAADRRVRPSPAGRGHRRRPPTTARP